MSFLTDCYTSAEGRLKVTRACIQRLLESGHKLRLQNRSVLVERDFDLLRAHPSQVVLGTSLPHLDDRLARILEPRAAGPTRRLRMLEKAANVGIPGLHGDSAGVSLPFRGRSTACGRETIATGSERIFL